MNSEALRQLSALASRRHAVFTDREARLAGLTARQLQLALEAEVLRRVDIGVLALTSAPSTPEQRVMAAVLASEGWASDDTAAALLRIGGRVPERPDVSIGINRRYRTGLGRVHRRADLLSTDLTYVGVIPVTNAVRTIIDCAATAPPRRLERMYERALQRELLTFDDLARRFVQLARSGRPGVTRMRELLTALDPAAAPTESELEIRMVELLDSAGLPTPVRQWEVRLPGRTVRLDLAYPELKIGIELDGRRFHTGRKPFETDPARRNALLTAGWLIPVFTWGHLTYERQWVAATVRDTIALRLAA